MTSLNILPNEILEQVLLSLPAQDLLLAQAVSQRWRAMVQISPRIQQALFFKPARSFAPIADPEARALLKAGKVSQAATALAVNSAPVGTPRWMLQLSWSVVGSSTSGYTGRAVKNALLEDRFERFLPISCMQVDRLVHATVMMLEPYDEESETVGPITPLPKSFLYPEASWRKMYVPFLLFLFLLLCHADSRLHRFITQTPCASGSFECTLDLDEPLETGHVTKFEGLRLGDIVTDDTLAKVGLVPKDME